MPWSLLVTPVTGNGVNGGTTAAMDTTGANLLLMSVGLYGPGSGPVTVSDSKGNTWIGLTLHGTSGGNFHKIYYCVAPPAGKLGPGHTFSYAATTSYGALVAQAWSGVDTAAPVSGENGADGTPATLAAGPVTPPTPGCLIVTGIVHDNNGGATVTIDSGFTIAGSKPYVPGTSMGSHAAYLIQAVAATVNPVWTVTGGSPKTASIAVFKAGADASQPMVTIL